MLRAIAINVHQDFSSRAFRRGHPGDDTAILNAVFHPPVAGFCIGETFRKPFQAYWVKLLITLQAIDHQADNLGEINLV